SIDYACPYKISIDINTVDRILDGSVMKPLVGHLLDGPVMKPLVG
ncbi:unnamed protein product, partial [Didymodactylos carnosus]